MKYLIATCGITHSGKTTFGENLKIQRPNLLMIDSDLIYSSMCGLIPQIKDAERARTDVSSTNPRLKHILFQETIKFFLRNDSSVLCTNGNTDQNARNILRTVAHEHDAKFILVHFNLPFKEIQKRITESNRPLDILTNSNNFDEVIAIQLGRFEQPKAQESDIFYEIQKVGDINGVMENILNVLET